MNSSDIVTHFFEWAPKQIAWERDNIGIQAGSESRETSNILLCLEATRPVIEEAIAKKCNTIVSHHPLLFNPIRNIIPEQNYYAEMVSLLLKNDITLISFHTNADFSPGGVSAVLAEKIGLKQYTPLQPVALNQFKVLAFVPPAAVEQLSESLFTAGAGTIGGYTKCSFRTDGIGTFFGSENTSPAFGKKQQFESVNEIKLEVLVEEHRLNAVLDALKQSHPYEEPAYEVYSLRTGTSRFGLGCIGTLPEAMIFDTFLDHVINKLAAVTLRYCTGKANEIKTVAVCGGSGSRTVETALARGADALITADITYHTFQEAAGRILLIDAGHYETEIGILSVFEQKLHELCARISPSSRIIQFSGSTNPVKTFLNKGEYH